MPTALLIDGYNLLHATGGLSLVRGPAALAKARDRMLAQIAASLSDVERLKTQIVFDARRSGSSEIPHEMNVRGMTISFAVGFAEADELLEQIIRQHPQPKKLTVVSSDLRIQRCATARKATAIGCDQYLMRLVDPPASEPRTTANGTSEESEPKVELSPEEVQKWLREFGL